MAKRTPSKGESPTQREFQPLSSRKSFNESDRPPRQLWWAPKPKKVEAAPSAPVVIRDPKPRVDSMSNIGYRPGGGQVNVKHEPVKWQSSPRVNSLSNVHWTPPAPQVNIPQEKLTWKAQPKINSFENIHHKPVERSVEIYHEKLDFTHVTPRVDCGFAN